MFIPSSSFPLLPGLAAIAPGQLGPDRLHDGRSLVLDLFNLLQIAQLRLKKGVHSREARMHQHVGHFRRDAGDGRKGLHCLGNFFFKSNQYHCLRLNINLPPC